MFIMIEQKKRSFWKIVIGITMIMILLLTSGFFLFKSAFEFNNVKDFGKNSYELYNSLPTSSKSMILIQIIILATFFLYFLFKGYQMIFDVKTVEETKQSGKLPLETELDHLYNIIKSNRDITISVISKEFKISEALAIEWAKILEAGNLIDIEYPGFGSPKLKAKTEVY